MFKWFKKLFHKTRLIERCESLDAIIEAHNELIRKTTAIMSGNTSIPPKYVLMRFNAIQDSEERAIAAYWRNKKRRADKWIGVKSPKSSTMSDIIHDNSADTAQRSCVTGLPTGATLQRSEELAATPPVEQVTAVPPVVEVTATPEPERVAATESTAQALEPSKESVIEIHINK